MLRIDPRTGRNIGIGYHLGTYNVITLLEKLGFLGTIRPQSNQMARGVPLRKR